MRPRSSDRVPFAAVLIPLPNYDAAFPGVISAEIGTPKYPIRRHRKGFFLRIWLNCGRRKRFLPKRPHGTREICVAFYDYGCVFAYVKDSFRIVSNIYANPPPHTHTHVKFAYRRFISQLRGLVFRITTHRFSVVSAPTIDFPRTMPLATVVKIPKLGDRLNFGQHKIYFCKMRARDTRKILVRFYDYGLI